MHGVIGQLIAGPVRVAIDFVAVIAAIAIIRRLSGLAFFDNRQPRSGRRTTTPASPTTPTYIDD